MGSNADVVKQYLATVAAGDWETAAGFLSEDVVMHAAGNNPGSGDHKGREEFKAFAAQMTAGVDAFEVKPHDLLVGDTHAVALVDVRFTRGQDVFQSQRTVVYHVGDGKITEVWLSEFDQAAYDAFMS